MECFVKKSFPNSSKLLKNGVIIRFLILKNYLIDLDRGIAGGVYLWKEKMHAEIWLGAEFRKMVRDNYGEEPTFQFFETPVVVDNITGDITKE